MMNEGPLGENDEKMMREKARTSGFISDFTRCNTPVVRRILELRHEQARLSGFENYAEMSISQNKMAGSVDRAREFLEGIRVRIAPRAQREYDELLQFVKDGENGDSIDDVVLTSPHVLYYAERLWESKNEKETKIDEKEKSTDLNVDIFLHGMFRMANKLFGVSLREIEKDWDIGQLHPSVRVYRVIDNTSGYTMGFIYFDLFTREGKSPVAPAWVAKVQSRSRLFPSQAQEPSVQPGLRLPVIHLCANIPASGASGTPGEQVVPTCSICDIFHEFGHALHYVLSKAEDASCGYENIEWDAVEIPSYFMERWGRDADTLRDLYGEGIVADTKTDNEFRKASNTMRQIQFGLADLALHSASPPPSSNEELYALLEKVARDTTMYACASSARDLLLPEDVRYPCFFSHIFTGDYAAGYYGYLWSDGLAADAFTVVKNDMQKGMEFRKMFIEPGSSTHPMNGFREFLGRDPDPDALFRDF
jgi:oligopeptidase A